MHWYQWTSLVLIIENSVATESELIEYEPGPDLGRPLYCSVKNIKQAKWMKGETTISIGQTIFDSRMSIPSKGTNDYHLHIKQMKRSDEGIYNCTDLSTDEIFKSYNLKSKAQAEIREGEYSGPTTESYEGETVYLWCNATGYPKPEVTWYTIEEKTSSEPEKWTYIGIQGNMLGIRNVSRYCATKFQCQAINTYGMDKPKTRNITFIVKFSPEIFVTSKPDSRYNANDRTLTGKTGDKVELICLIYASLPVNISWFRHNTLISEYIGITNETKKSGLLNDYLHIGPPTYDKSKKQTSFVLVVTLDNDVTFTSYHCQAENDVGSTRKTIDIKRNTKR